MKLSVTLLGTGTSTGVPMLACNCETCRSTDPRDNRFRASALLAWNDYNVVIDTTPEFRLQMLRAGVQTLEAVLLTHTHADHVNGLDDLRQFSFGNDRKIPVFTSSETAAWIRTRFAYIWKPPQQGGGLPKIVLREVREPFSLHGLTVTPVPVRHGIIDVYGYRCGNFAYLSDVSEIPAASMGLLQDLEVLVLDAVRYRPHATHLHFEAALEAARKIGAKKTYLTHLNHDFLHRRVSRECPRGIEPAYDGLTFAVSA